MAKPLRYPGTLRTTNFINASSNIKHQELCIHACIERDAPSLGLNQHYLISDCDYNTGAKDSEVFHVFSQPFAVPTTI